MTSNLIQAFKYFFKATVSPGKVINEFQLNQHKLAISFWITFIFSVLYSITAFLIYIIQRPPAITPWIPIAEDQYYLYQTFWTIPWGLATWIMISGICHLLAVLGKRDPYKYKFEDALVICSLAWVIPSFYLMWIPETFLIAPFRIEPSFEIETLRLMIIPPIWQTLLTAIGLRQTHKVGWVKGIVIGFITVATSFIMFLAFMR